MGARNECLPVCVYNHKITIPIAFNEKWFSGKTMLLNWEDDLALLFFQLKQDIPSLCFPQTCKHARSFIALIAQLLTPSNVHAHLREKMGKFLYAH